MFENSSITAALGRVKTTLDYSLKEKYGKEDQDITNFILNEHGLGKNHFDFITNAENLISSNLADSSVDTNANKNEVTMSGMLNEITTPINKLVGYRYLYRKLKELYGKKEAKRLSGELYDMSLALADSSKIMLPYCFSIDASKIVMEGRPFGQLHSAPPKRLSSYISALNETVHQLSNHLAGALAIGTFFFDVAHVLYYKEGVVLEELEMDYNTRKYIENCYQSFIHSVNHLSRNAVESPFTNISIFDREKLKTFLADDQMGWYFQDVDKEYIMDYIMELQFIFMSFFDKGDQLKGGKPFRFPVCTLNISKDTKKSIKLLDIDFIEKITKHEIYRYNILVSEGSKVASCCRLLNDSDLFEIGGQMNSFGGSGISLGSHRVVTINFNRIALEAESKEDYLSILNKRIEDAALILIAHRALIKELIDSGLQPFMEKGWLRLDRMFSTFGILGIVEMQETLKNKFGDFDYIAEALVILNTTARDYTKKYNNIFNIEQIPGESMAVKLCKIDKKLYGDEAIPYNLYTNQFIPLWEDVSIWERMDVDGKYNKMLTGGGIVHFNLGERVNSSQAKKIIEYACKAGCEHFALNSVYSECENDHTSFGNLNICPICNGKIIEKYTRIVGFMVPISSWQKVRREWEFPKRIFKEIN